VYQFEKSSSFLASTPSLVSPSVFSKFVVAMFVFLREKVRNSRPKAGMPKIFRSTKKERCRQFLSHAA
jgi:hypothetical protein